MSEKQLIWADTLLRAGVAYEICNVDSRNARVIPATATARLSE
jgi:hypothetical protein